MIGLIVKKISQIYLQKYNPIQPPGEAAFSMVDVILN